MSQLNHKQQAQQLLTYVASLEFEVDRLRKQGNLLRSEAQHLLARVAAECGAAGRDAAGVLAALRQDLAEFAGLADDLRQSLQFHPALDQVVTIAVRPLAEQIFRWQQRFLSAPEVMLRLDLDSELIDWFPARLRHVLDNLISNAIKFHDKGKGEMRVSVELRTQRECYLFRISDNGIGMTHKDRVELLEAYAQASPLLREAGLGVGLPVVRMLIEECGGTLTIDSGEGSGSSFVVQLPRYDMSDFLTRSGASPLLPEHA